MSNLKTFAKFANGYACEATPLYKGCYTNDTFLMSFKDKFWFDMELRGFELLKDKSYIPEIETIDYELLQISFKWYDTNLNHILHYNKSMPSDWRDQILKILKDLESTGIYKLNVYPHTFYLKEDKVHIMDLYACLKTNDIIPEEKIKNIINDKKRFTFNNGNLDIGFAYNYTLTHNVGDWPEGALNG